ncbi:hypothetical protein OSTOST_02633 [Ostertagia ostertagi]
MEEAAVPNISGAKSGGSLSEKYPTLLRSLTTDNARPTSSREAPASSSADEESPAYRRRFRVNLSGHLFHGVLEASKRGVHPVVRYNIPGGEYCYAFERLRTTSRGQIVIYRCTACRKKGTNTTIAVQNKCEFIGDPAELFHVCSPLENAKDQVTRMVYQSCRAIATDPLLAQAKPNQLWKSIAEFIDKNAPDDEAQRKEMLKHFYRNGYNSRRRSIARAAAKLHRPAVEKSCRAIATDPLLAQAKPNQLWKSIAEFIDKNAPDDSPRGPLGPISY